MTTVGSADAGDSQTLCDDPNRAMFSSCHQHVRVIVCTLFEKPFLEHFLTLLTHT